MRKEYLVQVQTVDIVWQGWVWRFLGIPVWHRRDIRAYYRHGTVGWKAPAPDPPVPLRLQRL